jgi:GNAT superfamily N-acetyltransferase
VTDATRRGAVTELRAPNTPSDWAAYHAIRRRVLFELRGRGSTYDAEHPDEHRPDHHPFLLWDGDTSVGVIRIDLHGEIAVFRRVAVRDDMQRRGYGRRLLELATQFAERQGSVRIDSHVDADAVGFYSRCGFARVDGAVQQGATVLMTKLLR